jgi:hypothetical protein
VVERLRGTKLFLKQSKYRFYQDTVKFLRFVISPEGV